MRWRGFERNDSHRAGTRFGDDAAHNGDHSRVARHLYPYDHPEQVEQCVEVGRVGGDQHDEWAWTEPRGAPADAEEHGAADELHVDVTTLGRLCTRFGHAVNAMGDSVHHEGRAEGGHEEHPKREVDAHGRESHGHDGGAHHPANCEAGAGREPAPQPGQGLSLPILTGRRRPGEKNQRARDDGRGEHPEDDEEDVKGACLHRDGRRREDDGGASKPNE